MDRYRETFETWNKIAKDYREKFMEFDLYNDTYDVFLSMLEPHSSVLEIGCGPGNISRYLLSRNESLKLKGIDISENMIALAKESNPMAEFEVMDCRHLDEINAKFDAIICGFCIPYLSKNDTIKLISDCNSLLNESGVLYLSFVEGDYRRSGFLSGKSGDRVYFNYHDLDFIKKQLLSNSIEIKETLFKNYKKEEDKEEVHTILISIKKNN